MATIRIDINSLRSNSGSAYGLIWVEFAERAIPCPRWDDFVVFVLDFWRRGIQDTLLGAQAPTPFAFMDDAYEFYAVKSAGGFKFRCTFHDEEIFSTFEDEAGMKAFVTSYFEAVRAVTERIMQDPQWRKTYSGTAGTLDDILAAQPGLELLLANYR